MEEWKEYRLEDVCGLVPGFAFKSKDFGDYETKAIKIKDIQPPFIDFEGSDGVCLTGYNKDKLKKYLVKKGDFLLAMTGATIGKIGRYTYNIPAYLNQRVLKFEEKQGVDYDFIYYYLSTQHFQSYIINHIDSESAQPNISAKTIGKYPVFLPSFVTQNRIVALLKSFDDKIEVNKRLNDNLQHQAQALYKSWFVDYEPFKNGEFVESELGMIPKGWRLGTLGEIIEIKYGKDHKKLSDGIIPVYGSGGLMRYAEKPLYEGESVLIPRKGTLNNVMYVNEAFWTVDTMFYTIPRMQNSMLFAYILLSNKDLASMNSGSAVPSMTTEILNNIQIVMPVSDVLAEFNRLVFAYYAQIRHYDQETRRLAQLRDAILPRLMSGELKVDEVTV